MAEQCEERTVHSLNNLETTNSIIQSVVRRWGLTRQEAEDISQTVWLRLLENIDRIRDIHALPGWVSTTTRNEVISASRRSKKADSLGESYKQTLQHREYSTAVDDLEERKRVLIEAVSELSDLQRQLVTMLIEDPQPSYSEISRKLKIPIGSIGPNRARALKRLRKSTKLSALR